MNRRPLQPPEFDHLQFVDKEGGRLMSLNIRGIENDTQGHTFAATCSKASIVLTMC